MAKEVLENKFSNQLIKKPLSNISSKNDSINIIGIIEKKSNQFPFKSPNLETALSDEVSEANEKGKWSLRISKLINDIITTARIIAEIPKVFPKFFGLRNPKSFQVIPLTFNQCCE